MLVRNPPGSGVLFIAPAIDFLLHPDVEVLHICKVTSLYELIFDVFKRGFYLAFFTGPVAGACV